MTGSLNRSRVKGQTRWSGKDRVKSCDACDKGVFDKGVLVFVFATEAGEVVWNNRVWAGTGPLLLLLCVDTNCFAGADDGTVLLALEGAFVAAQALQFPSLPAADDDNAADNAESEAAPATEEALVATSLLGV